MSMDNDKIITRLDSLEDKLQKKQDRVPLAVLITLFTVLCGQVFGYGVLYNRVDTSMSNRYTSTDAVRDIALVETRFERNEQDIDDLEGVDRAFEVRLRELEQRSVQ